MADYKYIIYEKDGEIARIILNRPDKLNALELIGWGENMVEFSQALDEAEADDELKVVIIKGAGRAFSSGQDLTKVGFVYGYGTGQAGERRPSQRIRLHKDRVGLEVLQRLLLFPKITIAQVHGYCLEGGQMLAMCCDVMIASEETIFGHPGQRLGFAGSGEPTIPLYILSIGLKRTRYLLLTGKNIDAREAERIGLVNEVVPLDQLEQRANELAQAFCLLPRDGIAVGKAHTHLIYDLLGVTAGWAQGYVMHTLFTNLRFEPGEWNFFKDRRNRGARSAIHEKDERFGKFV